MSESKEVNHNVAVPGEWALKKAFGPVLGEIGEDIKRLYAVGRDKILSAAYGKIENPDDGRQANLRVTRDVMWNGAFTDDEVCAEYFGGILASSRSDDGKDDSSIQFVDVIKSLSSKQLRLHYVIYNSRNKMFVATKKVINVGLSTELDSHSVWLSSIELETTHQINVETDFPIVFRQGLIKDYQFDTAVHGSLAFPYCKAKPTKFGVLLYAVAHNRLADYQDYSVVNFGDFESIPNVTVFANSLNELKKLAGFSEPKAATPTAESN